MKRVISWMAGLILVLAASMSSAHDVVVVKILDFSDFHGQLEPITVRPEPVGGAAYLDTWFDARGGKEPGTFIVTAGDAVGATPPISAAWGDLPTIEVMNMMGVDADTLGNHNFDEGVEHMRRLALAADYPFLVSNLVHAETRERPDWLEPYVVWHHDGVRIGVTGAINDDALSLIGDEAKLAPLAIANAADSINAVAAELRTQGIGTVVALVHAGATGVGPDGAAGPLIDIAKKLSGVDLLIGDHTNVQVNQPVIGADGDPVWVVENLSKGESFTEAVLTIDGSSGETLSVGATFQVPTTRGIDPDPQIQRYIDDKKDQLGDNLQRVVGYSTVPITQAFGYSESNAGNLLADAMRAATGADIVVTNTGGIRSALTRDTDRDSLGRYQIRRQYVSEVLPIANHVATVRVTGAELKTMLENGLSRMPTPNGRFPQVSGFQFSFNMRAAQGARVCEAKWPDGAALDLSANATYSIAMSSFMLTGGDDYPNFSVSKPYEMHGLMSDVLRDYIETQGTVAPDGPPHPAFLPTTRIHHCAA